ncbi:DEAD/DEAH box helicase [endosymbiont of Lamellibrachia barhami]|uniref:DEAD/DEAH box helicase n=1 Tax=endosymbiont of Lamellibrachia barhami TaxID=205975 RepID=UPI0015B0E864|nr:SNF2-related protein [endosymbiont of Lamellibrachia barhami]
MSKTKKRNKKSQRLARPSGWSTSDADEIERRRLRGLNEPSRIESQAQDDNFFGVYQVDSNNEQTYRVEIRSLAEPINSCDCPDHRINGLGTCKHIEATLNRLQYRRKRAFQNAAAKGSPYIEIFLDRRDHQVRIRWPEGGHRRSKARDLITPFFSSDNILAGNPLDTLPAMQRTINTAHPAVRRRFRSSHELNTWLDTLDRSAQRIRSRQHFETEVAAGNASLDLVKHPLYPYQQEGMLHLAFTGRALLADEMGLGKTVQAIAACELLRRTSGIRRVLVISPASLKGEWEEQIDKFTSLPASIIQGTRAKRLRQYEDPAFFSLANYEQIRSDAEEINTILIPDVIILDEAQRIKNWQTKTAISIKRLKSPYAFVLTGTPIENRIDEIYSIIQFLRPTYLRPPVPLQP